MVDVTRMRVIGWAVAGLVVLAIGTRWVTSARQPKATASPSRSARAVQVKPAAPRAAVVHVVGAVRRPGLYKLPQRSRVADAVARAGGSTRHADLSLINLAAPVSDGIQVVVPVRAPAAAAPAGQATGAGSAPAGPVHLNTATIEQLDSLPGVGPVTAQKILDYRQKHGAFSSLEKLDAIPGIGPARMEQLRDVAAP